MPWVLHHGRWPHGSDWLCEAAAETYLPLISACNSLVQNNTPTGFTLGISPILAEQLSNPTFHEEFEEYLQEKVKAAEADVSEYEYWQSEHMIALARHWKEVYSALAESFQKCGKNICKEFKSLADSGVLELITCGITHGYLPLLGRDWACRFQVEMAAKAHSHYFGKRPEGIWIPEMAYRPHGEWTYPVGLMSKLPAVDRQGVEEHLSTQKLRYFVINHTLLTEASAIQPTTEKSLPNPLSPFQVGILSSDGLSCDAITRNPEAARLIGLQFIPGELGFPAGGDYLDFHKRHFPGGHRYWRVTSSTTPIEHKHQYSPEKAQEALRNDARAFVDAMEKQLMDRYKETGKPGLLSATYDAELFGHWWREGIDWMSAVMEELVNHPDIAPTTVSQYLAEFPPQEHYALPEGSWGEQGDHSVWLNPMTEWTWNYLWMAELSIEELIESIKTKGFNITKAIQPVFDQLVRELLLTQASDWQFLISGGAARDYAEARFREHSEALVRLLEICSKLVDDIGMPEWDSQWLGELQKKDNPFPWLSFNDLINCYNSMKTE